MNYGHYDSLTQTFWSKFCICAYISKESGLKDHSLHSWEQCALLTMHLWWAATFWLSDTSSWPHSLSRSLLQKAHLGSHAAAPFLCPDMTKGFFCLSKFLKKCKEHHKYVEVSDNFTLNYTLLEDPSKWILSQLWKQVFIWGSLLYHHNSFEIHWYSLHTSSLSPALEQDAIRFLMYTVCQVHPVFGNIYIYTSYD